MIDLEKKFDFKGHCDPSSLVQLIISNNKKYGLRQCFDIINKPIFDVQNNNKRYYTIFEKKLVKLGRDKKTTLKSNEFMINSNFDYGTKIENVPFILQHFFDEENNIIKQAIKIANYNFDYRQIKKIGKMFNAIDIRRDLGYDFNRYIIQSRINFVFDIIKMKDSTLTIFDWIDI